MSAMFNAVKTMFGGNPNQGNPNQGLAIPGVNFNPNAQGSSNQGNSTQGTQQNSQGQTQQTQQNTQQTQTGTNNPDQVVQNNVNAGNAQASPLDAFSKLWENPTNQQGNNSDYKPLFGTPDVAKLTEQVGKMNFADRVNPELLQKAMSGDAQSMLQVLNGVGQSAFQQAFLANSQMTDKAFQANLPTIQKSMESQYTKLRANETFAGANPAFSHPAVKPLFEFMQAQFQQQFPNATPQEIATHTQNYFTQVGGLFNQKSDGSGNNSATSSGKREDGTDWANFFS